MSYWSLLSKIKLNFFKNLFQFSRESAHPKTNQNEKNRQFDTCSSDSYILVLDFRRPPSNTGIIINDDEVGDSNKRAEEQKKKRKLWEKLRNQTLRIIEKLHMGNLNTGHQLLESTNFELQILSSNGIQKICYSDIAFVQDLETIS